MTDGLIVLLIVLVNAVVLVLGGLVTRFAYRAYQRTHGQGMRLFTLGFALLTLGFAVGGGLHQLLGADLLTGVFAQSLLTALGFVCLVYSLYVREPDEADAPVPM